jgi:hypothetical protein
MLWMTYYRIMRPLGGYSLDLTSEHPSIFIVRKSEEILRYYVQQVL